MTLPEIITHFDLELIGIVFLTLFAFYALGTFLLGQQHRKTLRSRAWATFPVNDGFKTPVIQYDDCRCWYIRRPKCPCSCGGEGYLQFLTCPECLKVVLMCSERGTVFTDPHDLTARPLLFSQTLSADVCPECHSETITNFRSASIGEILEAGFTTDSQVPVIQEIFRSDQNVKAILTHRSDKLFEVEFFRWIGVSVSDNGEEYGYWVSSLYSSLTDSYQNAIKIIKDGFL